MVADYEERIRVLTKNLAAREEELAQTKRQNHQLGKDQVEQQQRLMTAEEKVRTIRIENDDLMMQVKRLSDRLEMDMARSKKTESRIKEKNVATQRLEDRLEQLELNNRELTLALARSKETIEDLKRTIAKYGAAPAAAADNAALP